jgi:sugar diacid utilization regulator
MYNQLKKIYKDALIHADAPHSFSRYTWFLSPANEYLGIEKSVLEKRDLLLLETFLQQVEESQLSLTAAEKWWYDFLFHKKDDTLSNMTEICRFIHFQFSELFPHKEEWKEAISAFFDNKIEVIWRNGTNGVIIEFIPQIKTEDAIPFADIADTTASDFYSTVKLYVGSYSSFNEALQTLFSWEEKCFQISLRHWKKSNIHSFDQAIPYLVTGQLDEELITQIKHQFSPIMGDEHELLQSIKVFIEHNMNVSLTAKKLFMHRNSLQYRIDKFIERSGIDIKNFQGALAAYLAIIIIETEQRG